MGKNVLVGACWAVTTQCNMKCPICYSFIEKEAISKERKKQIVDILSHYKFRKISFGGGEPLLDNDIISLIKYAHNKGIKTGLCTNGLLLTDEILNELNHSLIELSLPLEGSTSYIHSKMRGTHDHYFNTIKLLKITQKYDVLADVSTVVTKQNVSDILNISKIIVDHGIKKWKLFQFISLGKGYHSKKEFQIAQTDFLRLKNEVKSTVTDLEIDFGSGTQRRMKSYVNISPTGNIFVFNNNSYNIIGNLFSNQELISVLVKNKFNFQLHNKRHFRDGVKNNAKRKESIHYY